MDRREFLVGTAAVGTGTVALTVSSTVYAATCEVNLYNPTKTIARLTYPAKPGETPEPINLEWPPGTFADTFPDSWILGTGPIWFMQIYRTCRRDHPGDRWRALLREFAVRDLP